jgi:hypothetical protein
VAEEQGTKSRVRRGGNEGRAKELVRDLPLHVSFSRTGTNMQTSDNDA